MNSSSLTDWKRLGPLEGLQGERYAWIEETNECVLMDKDMNLLYEDDVDSDYDFDPFDDAEEK